MNERLFEFDEERRRASGALFLCGVDEAGRGPWAGPVAAAAVVLRPETRLPGLNDSKKLSEAQREKLYDVIQREALCCAVSLVGPDVIDQINILQATFQAMRQAVLSLTEAPQRVLVDGNRAIPHLSCRQEAVVGGDGKSACVAAASVLAKVTRDRLMRQAHDQYPPYGFHLHKGYGTPAHLEALRQHGPCDIHRRSFAPIKNLPHP